MNDQSPASAPLPKKKFPPGAAVLISGLLALLGLFLHEAPADSAGDCNVKGRISLFLVMGASILWIPCCGLMALVVWRIDKQGWLPRWCQAPTILMVGLMLPVLGLVFGLSHSTAKGLYSTHVGVLKDRVSNIQVSGFRALLASRWLFAFDVTPEDAALIASKRGLHEGGTQDLKLALPQSDLLRAVANDPTLSSSALAAEMHAANPADLKVYSREETRNHGQTDSWMSMVVDVRQHRAWLYAGFQN